MEEIVEREQTKEMKRVEAIKIISLNSFLIPKAFVPKWQSTCVDQEERARRIVSFANGFISKSTSFTFFSCSKITLKKVTQM